MVSPTSEVSLVIATENSKFRDSTGMYGLGHFPSLKTSCSSLVILIMLVIVPCCDHGCTVFHKTAVCYGSDCDFLLELFNGGVFEPVSFCH